MPDADKAKNARTTQQADVREARVNGMISTPNRQVARDAERRVQQPYARLREPAIHTAAPPATASIPSTGGSGSLLFRSAVRVKRTDVHDRFTASLRDSLISEHQQAERNQNEAQNRGAFMGSDYNHFERARCSQES